MKHQQNERDDDQKETIEYLEKWNEKKEEDAEVKLVREKLIEEKETPKILEEREW